MADKVARVFISSVGGGYIAQYRLAATEACYRLGLQPIAMEEFSPESPPPLDVCKRRVRQADVLICIVGHRYGSRPPGSNKSFTEHEYECAYKEGIPLHVYVADPNHPWPTTEIDKGEDHDALNTFKGRLKLAHTVRSFRDVDAFREDVLVFLSRFSAEMPVAKGAKAVRDDARRIPRPPAPHYVPPYVSSQPFTGRVRELSIIDEWAKSDDGMLVIDAIGGNGKSALVWEWAENRAHQVIDGLAGRFWWSFYEGAASMEAFLIEATAYLTGWTTKRVRRLSAVARFEELTARLRGQTFVIVLDGLERLLRAYHRLDAGSVRDDQVDESARSLINYQEANLLRQLARCGPSKVLVSTRLVPIALENATHDLIPGVRRHELAGLASHDTLRILTHLGVKGEAGRMKTFFDRLENHPLLVGMLAALIRDYRTYPGNFDRWVTDAAAGGSLRLGTLDLVQRRTHILAAAMNGLHPDHRRLLGWIAELPGSVNFETLEAINPFRRRTPFDLSHIEDASEGMEGPQEGAVSIQERSPSARLDSALADLEDRGLLWWDRSSNTYSLHPVVRAYAQDRLEGNDRVEANERIKDFFSALPEEDTDEASSVDQLRQTITIFTALVRAGRIEEAHFIYTYSLMDPLLYRLAAYSTIVELMQPFLEPEVPRRIRAFAFNDAGIAQQKMGRMTEGEMYEEESLSYSLADHDTESAAITLANLSAIYRLTHKLIAAEHALVLAERIAQAASDESLSTMLLVYRAVLLLETGRVGEGRQSLTLLRERPWPLRFKSLRAHADVVECYFDFVDGTLTETALDRVSESRAEAESFLLILILKRDLASARGNWEAALAHGEAVVHFARGMDRPTPGFEGVVADALAHLDRLVEARSLIEECLSAAAPLHPVLRPHLAAASVFWRCGLKEPAIENVLEAHRIAWADGPPYCVRAGLESAQSLMSDMGIQKPVLPTRDPNLVHLPYENKVEALIRSIQTK